MVTLKTIQKIRKRLEEIDGPISKTKLGVECKVHPYAVNESLPILEELGVCNLTRLNRITIISPILKESKEDESK